jgi:hypothetical protein
MALELYLTNTRITDDGLKHLASLRNLRYLWLIGTDVTDTGLLHLIQLKNLQKLNLVGTKVTDEGISKLKRELPNCQISMKSR